MKNQIAIWMLVFFIMGIMAASVAAQDVADVMPVYNSLRAASWGDYMFLQEHSSDAIFVPQRGGDWGDGGIWRALQEHTWTPTLSIVNGAWVDAYTGIARANSTIDSLKSSPSDSPLIPTLIAEVRFLRAFYYWWLMDLYGDVPLVTDAVTDPDNPPHQSPRQDVFDFIVAEINTALPDLEDSFGSGSYGRATKGAANALLATVYLNAEVYTGTAMWSECVAACDAVINSGNYDLMSPFNDVFALENEGLGNVENILVVVHEPREGVGFFRQQASLHYNQLPSTPWNGFSVLADFYNAFDTSDVRIDQLLVGPQVVLGGPNAGEPATDRQGNPLIFTVESPLTGATEGNGVRILKWPVDPDASGPNHGNDYAIFRYSHVLLAKAEAQFMLGNTGEALDLVNQVRERAFDPDKPLTNITLDDMLAERGFELLWEGFRRQDLIRTGHFFDPWTLKEASAEYRKLFPIPQIQLDANPNLKQNDGYVIVGVPDISVFVDTLAFGERVVGVENSLELFIRNDGTEVLEISDVTVDTSVFSAFPSSLSIASNTMDTVTVKFLPTEEGDFTGILTITSNDPDEAVLELPVTGHAIVPQFTRITKGDIVNDHGFSLVSNWIDYDNDKDLDLFVANWKSSNPNFLYQNNGDGSFTKITEGEIVTVGKNDHGSSWADYDNDGNIDAFVANFGQKNRLFKNNGDGTFATITTGEIVNEASPAHGTAWGDYDNDSFVDLFVANRDGEINFLYRNNGDGTFSKVTEGEIVNDGGTSFGCSWADYDNDGDLDLFVANGGWMAAENNFLYQNNGDGTFLKITGGPVVSDRDRSYGGSWGDYDNDGDLDLFVTNNPRNFLYQNNGDGTFTRIFSGEIVGAFGDHHGSAWGDYNNDGFLDLFVSERENNLLYENNGDGTFTQIVAGELVDDRGTSTGSSWGDFDNDGDLDLFVANSDSQNNFLYVNGGNENNWINIKCVGTESNKSAIGAKVRLKANVFGAELWQLSEFSAQTGGGYGGQNSLNAEFGLGDASVIDTLKIEWPSGIVQVFEQVDVNQFISITEGDTVITGIYDSIKEIPKEFSLNQNYPNPFNPTTVISYHLSAVSDVELTIYNQLGQRIKTLVKERQHAGAYQIEWDGRDHVGKQVASGVYLYRLKAGSFVETRKMVLLR